MERWGEIYRAIADGMDRAPADPEAQNLVGEWRQPIMDSFHNCTMEIFRELGDLCVNNRRLTQNIDAVKPGLAQYFREAIVVYCGGCANLQARPGSLPDRGGNKGEV